MLHDTAALRTGEVQRPTKVDFVYNPPGHCTAYSRPGKLFVLRSLSSSEADRGMQGTSQDCLRHDTSITGGAQQS